MNFKSSKSAPISELFWEIWKENLFVFPSQEESKNTCFVFQLIVKSHRKIVNYQSSKIYFTHANQIKEDNQVIEVDFIENAKQLGWKTTKKKVLEGSSLEEEIEKLEKSCPFHRKGFFVESGLGERLSVTSTKFIAVKFFGQHYRVDSIPADDFNIVSDKEFLELFSHNEAQILVSYFKEWRNLYQDVCNKIDRICKFLEKSSKEGIEGTRNQKIKSLESIIKKYSIDPLCALLIQPISTVIYLLKYDPQK